MKTWHEVYEKLADELKKFYDSFQNNPNKNFVYAGEEFFYKCSQKDGFYELFNWANNISETSIDPFHIFVSFNNSGTTFGQKVKRLQFYFDVLECKVDVAQHFKDNRFSAPHIIVMKLLANRAKESQNDIWKFFVGIISDDLETIRQGFKDFRKWYGIGFSVITEMMFWIGSSKYISLDKNTTTLLLKYEVIKRVPKDYDSYNDLLRKKEGFSSDIFRLLVKYAYDSAMPDNENDRKQLSDFLNISTLNSPTEKDNNTTQLNYHTNFHNSNFSNFTFGDNKADIKFQLIAIKVLDSKNKKYKKNLQTNQLYLFNNSFEFDVGQIVYHRHRDVDLYKIGEIDISINAIVGENGSGKSTLMELAFMIINNLSRKIFEAQGLQEKEIRVTYINGINAELYFVTDQLYKITVNDKSVAIEKFRQIGVNAESISYAQAQDCTDSFSFDNLYYTNHINYSLHSLNQKYFGDWIHNLFHRNDSYQTPITIEPYRKHGIIDINLLQSLMKNRLLSYILDNGKENFRQFTKKEKAQKIILTVDYLKFTSYFDPLPTKDELIKLVKSLGNVFSFDVSNVIQVVQDFIDGSFKQTNFDKNLYINEGDEVLLNENFKDIPIEFFFVFYIYRKLHSLIEQYRDFSELKNSSNEEILEAVRQDTSHSTFKIRQAIYNLKYIRRLNFKNEKMIFDIAWLSNTIENEILAKEVEKDVNLRIDDLMPSSIFKVEIILENGGSFDGLSSGEKQKIFVLNSIMYHLRNIASKDDGYLYVNVVLDEIELYFHPGMQRDFIDDLLVMLKNNEYINNFRALNFMLITHSPFILSDVIDNNLLMLDINAQPLEKNKRTFGANIYDLLHDGFFMEDGFIGKFAEKKIKQVIDIVKLCKILQQNNNNTDVRNLTESYSEFIGYSTLADDITLDKIEGSKNRLFAIADSIGEPILRNKLVDDLKSIFEKAQDDDLIKIVDDLKNKTYEDIKLELDKYSIDTQEKILNKLFGNK